MEEAEALSTKMGILVHGGIFRCMGTAHHIKNKFGSGYETLFKMNIMDDETCIKKLNELKLVPQDKKVIKDFINILIKGGALKQNERIDFEHSIINQIFSIN